MRAVEQKQHGWRSFKLLQLLHRCNCIHVALWIVVSNSGHGDVTLIPAISVTLHARCKVA